MGAVSKLLTAVLSLSTSNSTLPQSKTNGNSSLGTLSAPRLSNFLTSNPLPDGYPWGKDTVYNTNPYSSSPSTGVVRTFNWTVSRGKLAPDGYQRDMILVNGQFPGPTIEVNWGDTIKVIVNNNLSSPADGTAIHWHGFLQHKTPWMDGVPGLTQCPIPPGKTFIYQFKAELYGTTWYHAHYQSQYSDGVFGPIVVHGPEHTPFDIDLGPILLSDYIHITSRQMVQSITTPKPPPNQYPPPNPTSDNNLINGKGNFDCSTVSDGTPCVNNAGMAKFMFSKGKKHRLRLVNTGSDGTQQFSIDNHTLTVIANDFVPVQPYNTTIVTLGIGQRTDVVVTATGQSDAAYWMRSNITCSSANQPYALAIIYYEKANTTLIPKTSAQPVPNPGCANDQLSLTVPAYKITPPAPSITYTLNMTVGQNRTWHWVWNMTSSDGSFTNSPFRADYNSPILPMANEGNVSYPLHPEWNILNTYHNSSYRIVINNETPLAHPMHMHGHNFFVLSVGTGSWDGTSIVDASNPQRRDTQLVPAFGYMVVQLNADNPGTWALHCHIAWHSATGLFVDIVERPKDIKRYKIPNSVSDNCMAWNAYTQTNVVDQIDSGN